MLKIEFWSDIGSNLLTLKFQDKEGKECKKKRRRKEEKCSVHLLSPVPRSVFHLRITFGAVSFSKLTALSGNIIACLTMYN
jgi:hypothetical protein